MTPIVQAYLLALLADRRAWFESMRATLAANGVATDRLEETLLEIAEVERELTGEASDDPSPVPYRHQ